MKTLKDGNVPCWYELSFKGVGDRLGLLLRVHGGFVARHLEIPVDVPGVVNFMRGFDFKKFSGRFGADLGFEDSLKFLGTRDEFFEYEIPTPLVKKLAEEPCDQCDGKGYDEELGQDCFRCEAGKVFKIDYKEALAVSASLTLLFGFLSLFERTTTAQIPQLMFVDTVTVREPHGASLGGEFCPALMEYLRSRLSDDIPEMVSAMRTVCGRMEGTIPRYYQRDFAAYTQGSDGWLIVRCPGDAAGLSHSGGRVTGRPRYEFFSNNVDNFVQQFELLAALAALHDLARAAR